MTFLRTVTPALHKLDHAIGRLSARRDVLFEMRTPVYHAVLAPIAEALAAEPHVNIWYTSEYPDRVRPLVPARQFLTHAQAEWRRLDVYINGDPWAAARLRRCAHRVSFFHGVAGKYDLDNPAGLPMGFEYYSRVAFINRDRMQRYLQSGIVTPEQAVLIGYPKLDRLASGGYDGGAVRESLGLARQRATVVYAPTYSPASSLHLAGEGIVSTLAESGFNVIVKLHDRSLDPDPRYNDGIDWRARFAALAEAAPGRIAFATGADASQLLAAADVMITDHSSVGFEYLVLDRPLIVFDAPDLTRAARINPEKVALLRSAARVVASAEHAVCAAIEELANPEARSAARRRVARDVFFEPGSATARAADLVRTLLTPSLRASAAPIAAGPEAS
jgi:hypothetical protein